MDMDGYGRITTTQIIFPAFIKILLLKKQKKNKNKEKNGKTEPHFFINANGVDETKSIRQENFYFSSVLFQGWNAYINIYFLHNVTDIRNLENFFARDIFFFV